MHTRRVGAFLVGAWLLGTVLVWFLLNQSLLNVDRTLTAPPAPVTKELEDMGPETARQLLRYQALQHNRHVTEAWQVIQLGLGAALLATAIMTAHRSRMVIGGALAMTALAAISAFAIAPTVSSMGREVDFLPATAALRERDSLQLFQVWYRVLEILKIAIGLTISGRILFDRNDWRSKLTAQKTKVVRRRHRDRPTADPTT